MAYIGCLDPAHAELGAHAICDSIRWTAASAMTSALVAGVAGLSMTQQHTYLVTGSTEGIGLVTAQQLSTSGHRVLVHGRSEAKVAKVVASLGGSAEGFGSA